MASKTQIGNKALIHIGVTQLVADLDTENSNEARTINTVYEDERDAVLRAVRWPFARKYADGQLVDGTEDASTNSDWQYAYRVPSDCMFVRRIVSTLGRKDPTPIPFAIGQDDQGGLVFTDQEDAEIEYTVAVTDTARFDALFRTALEWKIAGTIAPALSRVKDILATCNSMYMKAIDEATVAALNESQADEPPASEFERSRA